MSGAQPAKRAQAERSESTITVSDGTQIYFSSAEKWPSGLHHLVTPGW
jgi:hypothetical protein